MHIKNNSNPDKVKEYKMSENLDINSWKTLLHMDRIPDTNIIKYTPAYSEAVMDIWLKANVKAHHFLPEQYWLDNYEKVKTLYLPNSDTFLYLDSPAPTGFISIIESNFIGALFIDVKMQCRGIGTKLLDYCKERYSSLELAVYKENIKAVNFYTKRGFKITDTKPNSDSGHIEHIMLWRRQP